MTVPAQIAALRVAVQVRDERPGTLTSLLARLERYWRESEAERERAHDRRRDVCESDRG